MPGFFGSDPLGESETVQQARQIIDPKGAHMYDIEYFRLRRSQVTSIYADEDVAKEGHTDWWIYRDERFAEVKEKEIQALEAAVAALAKFLEASQRSSRLHNQIVEEFAPLLSDNLQLADTPEITTADFDLKPLEES